MSSSKTHFVSLLLIALASLSFAFSMNPEDPSVLDRRQQNHFSTVHGKNVGLYPTTLRTSGVIVNVDHFGATGDEGDDTQGFMKAWKMACSSELDVDIVVPMNRSYHLKPIDFSGPCKSRVTFKIFGTIKASADRSAYSNDGRHWMVFENLENFRVLGGGSGTINGNGRIWWENSCKVNESLPCTSAPNAVTFIGCNNLVVDNLKFKNSQKMHLAFQECVNVEATNLVITAPEESPNTDGIHVTETKKISITNCVIMTGDDCISIVSGSADVTATDITCGPGHGISIGSLGAGNSVADVTDVTISRVKLTGTTNGLRIKTWQGGSGYAKSIRFRNVMMTNVTNPIIIDQHYCDQETPCEDQASAVQISKVLYDNIRGTSASNVAVKFDCSKQFRCEDILLRNVNLKSTGETKIAEASCENVGLSRRGSVSPKC